MIVEEFHYFKGGSTSKEYDDVNTAIKQARKLNRNDGRKAHYTVYIAKNGKGIVVGIDKDKVPMGNSSDAKFD